MRSKWNHSERKSMEDCNEKELNGRGEFGAGATTSSLFKTRQIVLSKLLSSAAKYFFLFNGRSEERDGGGESGAMELSSEVKLKGLSK